MARYRMNRRETEDTAKTAILTDYELDGLAKTAAKRVCQQGYTPAQAAQVVNLSDHAFAEVCEWYNEWSKLSRFRPTEDRCDE